MFLLGRSAVFFVFLFLLLGCGSRSNLCSYPKSLTANIEKKLKKSCSEVQAEELVQIKSLQFGCCAEDVSTIKWDDLKPFTQLSVLDFSGNKNIKEIPDFVYSIPKLKKLDISLTGVSNFDPKLCQLKNLEVLIGKNNSYKNNEIPFHTFCLENLKTLDMSDSSIIYVDDYIYYLSNLEKLYLKGNHLHSFPQMIKYMFGLQLVDLQNNKFSDNPEVNALFDCTVHSDSEDVRDCQEDLRESLDCEFHYKFNHQRGEPFRKWKSEAGDDRYLYLLNTHDGERHEVDQARYCYEDWLAFTGGFDSFEETSGFDEAGNYKGRKTKNAPLLEKTINGKTIREWRLTMMTMMKRTNPGWTFSGAPLYNSIVENWNNSTYANALEGDFCRLKISWRYRSFGNHTYFLPDRKEIFPEWHMPKEEEALARDPKCLADITQ